MELKHISKITEADLSLIENPFFGEFKVRTLYFKPFPVRIKGLEERVKHYMEWILRGQDETYAYWKYYKSGGLEDTWEYKFHYNDPIKEAIQEEIKRADYLLICDSDTNGYGGQTTVFDPLLIEKIESEIAPQDRWRIPNPTVISGYDRINTFLLKRLFPERKALDYTRFFGSASGGGNTSTYESMPPEPWPEEQRTSLVATAPQPSLQPTSPAPKPAPQTTQPQGTAANDPVFNVKKGLQLARVLGSIPAILIGALIPDNASLEKEWEVDGVKYKYNTDDFTLETTHPDGTKEDLKMYPDGTVMDNNGAIVGSTDKHGTFEPATEQEEVDYRVWKANGGDGSFAVWKNSGKPLETTSVADGAKSKAIEIDTRDGGHSVARHGADVTDEELKKRLETGIAPDGKFSPTPASTRFKSHEEWLKTRYDAVKGIEEENGVDLSKPPKPGEDTRYDINIDHGRAIDDGFIGDKSTKIKIKDPVSGKKGPVYPDSKPVSGITRTQTSVEWNRESNAWEVKQHYPDARNWDQSTQGYRNK